MKRNIAIVAGGDSGEYEVSLKSAGVVARNLDKNLYIPYIIIIEGSDWYYLWGDDKIQVDRNNFTMNLDGEQIIFDCVFVAIHGTPGEDGKLQGYFELLKIPYTTCDWIASGLTFDKELCKTVVRTLGIDVPAAVLLRQNDVINAGDIIEQIGLPCFVKPNKGGSSVGMTKVMEEAGLLAAIDFAFKEDDEVLIEQFIQGREISCGIFKSSGRLYVLPITEIESKKEFFDYEAKYDGMADEITPADIEENVDWECKTVSTLLYNKLNLKGVVRFDYIYNNSGMYFLEVNTVPGFSEASIVPQQAVEMGFSLEEFFGMIIEEALC